MSDLYPLTERLLSKAQRRAKLSDLGPESYLRFVDESLRDVDANGNLSRFGRFSYCENVVRCTVVRLRLVELVKQHPEILEVPVASPVVITGLYRSGTTLLHRLLAGSPDFRAPLFWELRCIDSDASLEKKLRAARWSRRIHRILSPGFEDAHEILADDAEECFHLFEHCAPTSPWWMTEARDCAWQMLDDGRRTDMVEAYEFLKLQLQVLQWRHPANSGSDAPPRLLLKWPFHLWNLDSLFEVFPDANVVVCRRDLDEEGFLRTVASTCSLAGHGLRPFCREIDKLRLGAFWREYCAEGVRRGERAMRDHPERIVEVPFGELVAESQRTASTLCSRLRVRSPAALVLERLEQRKRKHRYRLEDYGLES